MIADLPMPYGQDIAPQRSRAGAVWHLLKEPADGPH